MTQGSDLKINNLYEITDINMGDDQMGIRLLKDAGKYEGIVFRYGQIKFADKENNDGTYTLTFDWDLIKYNDIPKEELNKEDMSDIICDIIEELLELAINNKEGIHVGANNNRKDDSVSVNLQ